MLNLPSVNDETFTRGSDPDSTFGDWFSRPVRIQKYTWAENAYLAQSFNPWSDYFSSPEIYAKIKGFSRLRCKLHVKLVINASPFQYSLGLMSYRPLVGTVDSQAFSGGAFPIATTNTSQSYMVHTQYPSVYFKPQLSSGCEMTLPFIYYKDWINTMDSSLLECVSMGRMTLQSFAPLYTSSPSAAANPITVSIYAWAEDIELSGPSMCLQNDEYSDRPVSTVASAVAAASGALVRVPIIGPYMRATQMAASTLGSVAHWFGFSNPPVIDAVRAVKLSHASNFASPEVGSQVEKISMDPKTELTVDSRTVGMDGVDHMSFKHMMDRFVWFSTNNWLAADSPDSFIFSTHVTPVIYLNTAVSCPTFTTAAAMAVQMTPGSFISQNFEYWTGPITYRFVIVASKFHRGRLRITYDPNGPWTSGQLGTARLHQQIWDISESDTFEYTVPFMAATSFLEVDTTPCAGSSIAVPFSSRLEFPAQAYASGFYNGTLQVSVMNELTASVGSTVTLQCFIKTPDVEFASVKDIASTSPFTLVSPQSDDITENTTVAVIPVESTSDKKYMVYMGESVNNFRSIIHRTVFWDTIKPSFYGAAPYIPSFSGFNSTFRSLTFKWCIPRLPLPMYTVTHEAVANSRRLTNGMYPWSYIYDGGTTEVYGSTSHTLPMTLLTACYAGWRGSVVWRGVYTESPDSTLKVRSVEIGPLRKNWTTFAPTSSLTTAPANHNNNVMGGGHIIGISDWPTPTGVIDFNQVHVYRDRNDTPTLSNGAGGCVRATVDKIPMVEGILPHYSPYRMFPSNNARYQALLCGDTTNVSFNSQSSDTFGIEMTVDNITRAVNPLGTPTIDLYASAGPDFTCFMFLAVPTLYRYYDWPSTVTPRLAPINND